MPNDGFSYVKTKKRRTRNFETNKKTLVTAGSDSGEGKFNNEAAIRRILLAKKEVETSDFYSSVLRKLNEGLNQLDFLDVKEIVCYGLGHFVECVGARYQFGLLLSLKDHFSSHVSIFDPIFYNSEINILRELGFEVITVNEEGKRRASPDAVTLIYLPHCPKQLTNNFLWSNWGPELRNCIIFSNSFSRIIESQPKRILKANAEYILNISPYTEELGVDNSFRYKDIFNDIAIHIFPQKKLNSVSQVFWNLCDEPEYSADETEFITNKFISALKVEN
ncbi:SRR1-like protein isoform X2 [Zootermopsis nevadensis]|nr:SRR1-like protein isoform X2 [Zootermopsis nevadensis]